MVGRAFRSKTSAKNWALRENLLICATLRFIPRGNSQHLPEKERLLSFHPFVRLKKV